MSWLYLGYKKSKDSPSPRATFPRVPSPPFARVLENRTPSNSSKSYHLLPQEKGQPLPPPSSLFENELVGAEHQENLDSEGNISNSKNTKTNVSFRPMSGLRRFDIEPGRENEYWTDNDLEGFCYRNDNFPPTPESPADYSNPLEDVLHRGVQVGVKKADDNASEQGSKMKVAMPRRDAKSRNGANSKDVEDAVACAGEHWCAFYGITYDDDNINDDGEDDSNNDGSNQKIAAEPYISLLPNVKKCKSAIVLAPPSQISLEERFLQLEKKKLEHEKQVCCCFT